MGKWKKRYIKLLQDEINLWYRQGELWHETSDEQECIDCAHARVRELTRIYVRYAGNEMGIGDNSEYNEG